MDTNQHVQNKQANAGTGVANRSQPPKNFEMHRAHPPPFPNKPISTKVSPLQ